MKKDQLTLYASNHRGNLFGIIAVAILFMVLRHHMYGMPETFTSSGWTVPVSEKGGFFGFLLQKSHLSFLEEGALLAFCLVMMIRQRSLYARIISGKVKEAEYGWLVAKISLFRTLYLVPWLTFLFMPLESAALYDHILGYVFIFALTAATAPASAPVLPLLLFDVGLSAAFALAVTILNHSAQETPYIGGAVFLFCVYVLFIGLKIRLSTLQLIDSKLQMQRSAQRADEANRAKSRFLALMSHEIRTPMTGIFGMINFLQETKLTEQQREFVTTIRDCSKTLLNTLNDILDFSKIESGRMAISKINFDLHSTLTNSARILQEIADKKGLTLAVNINTNLPQHMHGDPYRLQQVVMNLVNNAVKFTEKGSVELRAFFVPETPERIRIEIQDTGIGISKENIRKLFSAFSQADDSIARNYGGSGLGLSIAKSLVKLMGGSIEVTSEVGKGSTFWIELPYKLPVEGAKSEEDKTVADVPPQKILVTEDNAVSARVISDLLKRKGHQVTVVGSSDEVLKAVQAEDYTLIFMDINMPGRNGIDTTRMIKALGGKIGSIPVIALSANIMEDSIRQCYDVGMVSHIAKPYAPKDLYAAIANVLAGKQQQSRDGDKSGAPKKMDEVLATIRNEMGPGFLKPMVRNNLAEIERLMEIVQREFRSKNLEALGNAAHDIKSVSGMIGMQSTHRLAASIETTCLTGTEDRLTEKIANLEHAKLLESAEAEGLAESLEK